ncbi:MAG: hypothetical protein HYY01_09350 [Chloroflexi bacterium]|nr:hypothetical protein [Chloroflexota bacterium]
MLDLKGDLERLFADFRWTTRGFTDEENEWLDITVQNIRRLDDPYKQALAFYAVFRACLVKRPFKYVLSNNHSSEVLLIAR